MRAGWKLRKMNEVCELINGRAYKQQELLKKGKYRVLRVGNFFTNKDWYYSDLELPADKYCDKGDLLYAWSASFGPRIWNGEKVIYHYHIWKVIPNEKIVTKEFLFKLLEWDVEKIKEDHGTGTTMIHVGKGSMEERELPIPPLGEQKRIVEILDEAFAAIDKAKANVEKNLQNAKELFESYLQESFFNNKDGWIEAQLKDVFEIKPPKSEAKNKLSDNDSVSFLPMEDLDVLAYEVKAKQQKKLKEVIGSYTYFANNDVLLAKITPCFENGKIGIARNLTKGVGFGSSEYIVFRSKGTVIPEYLYYYLSRQTFRNEGSKRMSGAVGHKRVTKEFIQEYIIPFPKSKTEQLAIVDRFNNLSNEIKKLETIYLQRMSGLEEFKKSIVQKAFIGELTTKAVLEI